MEEAVETVNFFVNTSSRSSFALDAFVFELTQDLQHSLIYGYNHRMSGDPYGRDKLSYLQRKTESVNGEQKLL